MNEKQSVLTKEKIADLERELNELKLVKRKEIAGKIKVAMSYGDLSENSEYDEAKNEQAIIEGRIVQIEAVLKNVKVLDEQEISTDRVGVYSSVTIKNTANDRVETITIVGASESDPLFDKISDESPIGKGLWGKKKGDTADISLPNGKSVQYLIVDIKKPEL